MATVIRRAGSPNWFARFRVNGRDYTVSTGTTSKRDAEAAMRRMLATKKGTLSISEAFDDVIRELDRQAGEATSETRQRELLAMRQAMARRLLGAKTEKLTLSDAWQAWLDNPKKRNPGPVTIQNYRSEWERFYKKDADPKKRGWIQRQPVELQYLHEITPALAEDYATDLWKSNVAPGTYNAHINFLKSLFRVLKTRAGLVTNPWEDIPAMAKERESRRMLTPKELKKVCHTATGSLRYMIAIGLYTGMRLGDVVTLRWDAIHADEGFIEIMPMKTRRLNKQVRLPVHPVLEALLKELRAKAGQGEHLFPQDREEYLKDRGAVTQRIQQLFTDCGIQTKEAATNGHRRMAIVRVGFHSLRHSFVSLCAANRVPQVAIMELVGHGSPAMTALYSHAGDEQKAKAIAALPAYAFK